MKTRNQILELAPLREYDLIVLGGGILGAGVLQDAAARGLSVLLIEKEDFSSGTSSRTTKLIHGGLRHIEEGHLRLAKQLCEERSVLEQIAPHLVRDFSFVLPLMKKRPLFGLKATAALSVYDLFATKYIGSHKHRRLTGKDVVEAAPALSNTDVASGLQFYDAITDDSRLVIEIIKSAAAQGAHMLNYVEAVGFELENNQINIVSCRDRYSGQELRLKTKAVVNACGVWAGEVESLVNADVAGARPATGIRNRVSIVKDTHIVLPPSAFETNTALCLPNTDGRYIFVVPWQRALLVGSAENNYQGELTEANANSDEVDYLLDAVNRYNGQKRLGRQDVVSSWASYRPLFKSAGKEPRTTVVAEKTTRNFDLFDSPGKMVTVIGGELTNYRLIAMEVVTRVLKHFPAIAKPGPSRTRNLMLGGWDDKDDFLTSTAIIAARARKLVVEPSTIDHLIASYGKDALSVLDTIEREPYLNQKICPDFPQIAAEVPFCINNEMSVSLQDLLFRRMRLGMLHHQQCFEASAKVARILQDLQGWDDVRTKAELVALSHSLGRSLEDLEQVYAGSSRGD